MKKTIVFMLAVVLMLSMIACGNDAHSNNKQFANKEEMLQYLQGVWAVESASGVTHHFIFQGDQIFITTDAKYQIGVMKLLDTAHQSGELNALLSQNFATISQRMALEDFCIIPDPITWLPETGEITVEAGKLVSDKYSNVEVISISENSVSVKSLIPGYSGSMTKLSGTVDSSEHFETLFNNVVNIYLKNLKTN